MHVTVNVLNYAEPVKAEYIYEKGERGGFTDALSVYVEGLNILVRERDALALAKAITLAIEERNGGARAGAVDATSAE